MSIDYYLTDKDGNKLTIQQALDTLQSGLCCIYYPKMISDEEVYHMDVYCLIIAYDVYVNDTTNEIYSIIGYMMNGNNVQIAYDETKAPAEP